MQEDEIVNELIENATTAEDELHTHVEPHYNHYGNRGVADLYHEHVENTMFGSNTNRAVLWEVKSEHAIREVTGANEIIRQFNKMKKYFYEDDQWERPEELAQFRLVFAATKPVFEHLLENRAMYQQVAGQDVDLGGRIPSAATSHVGVYHPADSSWLRLGFKDEKPPGEVAWLETMRKNFTGLYSNVGDDIVELY